VVGWDADNIDGKRTGRAKLVTSAVVMNGKTVGAAATP
jgi:hypothetical protein